MAYKKIAQNRDSSIIGRIVIFTVIISSLAILITGGFITFLIGTWTKSQIMERNELVLERVESEVSAYLSVALSELEVYADQLAYFAGFPLTREIFYENLVMVQDRFSRFIVIDEFEEIILDTENSSPGYLNIEDTIWHKSSENGALISDVRLSPHGLPIITCITQKAVGGLRLAAELNIHAVWTIVDDIKIGTSGYATLATSKGRIIAHPDKANIFSNVGSLLHVEDSAESKVFLEAIAADRTFITSRISVDLPGWVLYLVQPRREAMLPLRNILLLSLGMVLLWTTAVAAYAFFRARNTLAPLRVLTTTIRKMDYDDLDREVPIERHDEIGELGTAFNSLLATLHEKNKAIQESERKYRLVIDNASDILLLLDEEGKLLFLNKRFDELSLHNGTHYIGREFAEVLTPDSREILDSVLMECRSNLKETREFHVRLVPMRGGPISLEIKLVPRRGENNEILFFGVARDVSEKAIMQSQLRQAEKLSSLGEIISGVAHEINNPISCITGYTDLLLRYTDLETSAVEKIEVIHDEAIRTSKIVKNLLSFARKNPMEKMPCDITLILQSVLEFRSYELRMSKIMVEEHYDEGLEKISADSDQLRQVFLNLINNAIHALQDIGGNRRLVVSAEQGESLTVVSIKDNGPGIRNENQELIFDPFFTTKEPGRGTGLGLSVSLGLVSDHGGRIYFNSNVGLGTEFLVELPSIKTEETRQEELPFLGPKTLPPLSVLVIDDEPNAARLMDGALTNMGCATTTVLDGRSGIESLKNGSFDEIICDYRMPDVDGLMVLQWITDNKPDHRDRFILTSGDLVDPNLKSKLNEGRIPLLRKPYSLDDLRELLLQRV